ncbi:DUF2141 domain-containing protein [Leptolyngbya ohadii]|uniref:DUF2141 domain-containing protein n=1 Tax=Leptolyngbya ohadii TaxID=1962290 RepID=UPI001CECB8D4|nr:DUF2141 domain-containing protein [Leptolyngbya ohadii]
MSPIAVQATPGNRLNVDISGLKNRQGQVCLSLFASGNGFPSQGDRAIRKQCVALTAQAVRVSFTDLPPGRYAVAVLHDTNRDGQANQNVLGIPTEGFGFSGNPTVRFGPPSFNETAVNVSGTATTIQVRMRYLL